MSRPTSKELKDIELANRMLDRATELAIRRPDRTAKIRPRAWEILRKVVMDNAYFQAPKLRAKPERVPKADKEFRKTCRALLKKLNSVSFGYARPIPAAAHDYVEGMTDLYRSHGWTYSPPQWYEDIREEARDRVLQTA